MAGPYKIICAPDSYKDCMSAVEAAQAMAAGVHDAGKQLVPLCLPIADGGEGFVMTLASALGANDNLQLTETTDPLGRSIQAGWLLHQQATGERLAVIELAAASGIERLTPKERDVMRTTTLGTGQLIRAAMDAGVTRLILGIGGSATNDLACGLAQALGYRFLDVAGQVIESPINGGLLSEIASIDVSKVHPRLAQVEIEVACDVDNPLYGLRGAACTYGPQKGASPEQVKLLDAGLKHVAHIIERDLKVNISDLPGAGAAGGVGGGAVAFLGAKLKPGIDLVLDCVNFDEQARDASLCLTGEGCLDGQSLSGKATVGVANRAARLGVKTVALAGMVLGERGQFVPKPFAEVVAISQGMELEQALANGPKLLREATCEMVRRAQQPVR